MIAAEIPWYHTYHVTTRHHMDHVPQISANDCLLFGDLCFVLESHEVFCAVLFVLLNSLMLLDKLQWDSMICRSSMLQLKVYDPHHKRGLCRRWAGLTQFCRAGFVTWIILRVEGNCLTFAHTGQMAYNFLWNCKELYDLVCFQVALTICRQQYCAKQKEQAVSRLFRCFDASCR